MKTRAVCALSPDRVELREVSVPDLGSHDVLVRAHYSIISTGTERWVITGQFHAPGQPSMSWPLVPGYQKVGVVEAVGAHVDDLTVGQVVFATISHISEGATSGWGGHILHSVCDQSQVIPLPDGLDPVKAASLVLTQVGYNGGSRPPVSKGDTALVVGDGLVGQWLAQTLRSRGAHVLLAGRRPERLALAREHSADDIVDVRETPLTVLAEGAVPEGFDIVADTIGTAESVDTLTDLSRNNGHLILNGYYRESEHLLSMQALHSAEITVHAPAGWTRERLLATLDLVASGDLRVRELVTHMIGADEADKAYGLVLNKSEPFLGICLDWTNIGG
jgi:bacteriochlorophyllide a dehydrogenase